MRYRAWHHLFGLACWLATHRCTRLARFVLKRSHPLWKEEWSPDY